MDALNAVEEYYAMAQNIDIWDGTISDRFEGGTGTKEDPYMIKSAEQLAYFAKAVNEGQSFEGKYINLMVNVELNKGKMNKDAEGNVTFEEEATPKQWTPIGTEANLFKGTFDGNNYKVSGLYINNVNGCVGLFGYNSGTIQNITVENGYINAAGGYVGGIAGQNINNTRIYNCKNKMEITGGGFMGGILGGTTGDNPGSTTIENCKNEGNINNSGCNVGGIFGWGNNITVKNSYNSGNITAGQQFCGGIGGTIVNATIEYCYNNGEIISDSFAGGIIGYVYSSGKAEIKNCYNLKEVSGGGAIGGIVGVNRSEGQGVEINNCYNIGNISGWAGKVGGIIGMNDTIAIISNCYNIGNISGSEKTNGIIGESANHTISKCYYLTGTASKGLETGDVAGQVETKSESDMKTEAFVNLLGKDNWKIVEGKNAGYPILK